MIRQPIFLSSIQLEGILYCDEEKGLCLESYGNDICLKDLLGAFLDNQVSLKIESFESSLLLKG